jgi:hypothetical protein
MLTETVIKAAKQTGKPYKLSDERGMYPLVTSEGGKYDKHPCLCTDRSVENYGVDRP